MKILLVIAKYDYGEKNRGLSFEYNTFYRFFKNLSYDVMLYDFMDKVKLVGKENMNKELLDIIHKFKPEVVFFVPFTNQFIPSYLNKIRKINKNIIAWMCDDKWRWDIYSKNICKMFSYVVTTDPDAVKKYYSIGYNHVILSQWASIPELYKRLPIKKDIDVSFVGQVNPWRHYLVNELKKRGIKIECFGYGWKNGRINQDGMIKVFNRSKINLNISNSVKKDIKYLLSVNFNIDRDLDYKHKIVNIFPILHTLFFPKRKEDIKSRFFEVTGCGGFLLSYNVEYLDKYFKIGKEIVCYDNVNDLINKIIYFLKYDSEREKIALAGYKRSIAEHTYKKRFNEVFSKIF